MSGNDDENTGGNVINFGRRTGLTGFNLTPVQPGAGGDAFGPVVPPPPVVAPTNGTGVRRSPLDALAALPSPTLTASPVVTGSRDGGLPDTFRGTGGGQVGSRMGALSLAACLAVAVAALRGTCLFLEDRRQRRLERSAETAPLREARAKHRLALEQARFGAMEAAAKNGLAADQAAGKHANAMQGIGNKAAEQRAKNNVPSGQEFGRKTLGGGKAPAGGAGKGPDGGAAKGPAGGGKGAGAGAGNKGTGAGRGALGSGGGKGATPGGGKKTPTGNGAGGKGAVPHKPNSPAKTGPGKTDAAALKKKPPLNGKAPGPNASSPAMERARRRQDRKDSGQNAQLKARAAKDAARIKEQAKDNKAARDHEAAAKKAQQTAKKAQQDGADKIRNARMQAKEGRKEQVRQGKFDAAQQQRGQKAGAKLQKKTEAQAKKEQAKAAGADRTKLWDALKKDTADGAGDRWAKRNGVPPLWKNDKQRQKKTDEDRQDKPKAGTGPGTEKPKHATPGPSRGERWRRARDRARWIKDGCFGGPNPTDAAGTAGPSPQDTSGPGPRTSGAGSGPQSPTGGSTVPPGGGQRTRKSPYENAASTGATTVTIERDDRPTSAASDNDGPIAALGRGIDALPAAPEPHTARPGTTRPKEPHSMPPAAAPVPVDPRILKARHQAARRAGAVTTQARHMDAQHATEITLDDALDEYGKFKDDAFKTHGQCAKLSRRARTLRDTLEAFAEELAISNNLIGAMFTSAMASLSESMELVARMADEMEISSLEAAELSESADNELNDAYRPITQATADAGLTTPSAPVHNRT